MKRKLILIGIIVISVVLVYNYIYKEHRDIASEEPAYYVEADELIEAFVINHNTSTTKYLDKTIAVSGFVTHNQEGVITLNTSIVCFFENDVVEHIKEDTKLLIKGRFLGYDELLDEIKLDDCSLITN